MPMYSATCDVCHGECLDGDIYLNRLVFRLRRAGWDVADDGESAICPACLGILPRPMPTVAEIVAEAKGHL